VKAGTLATSPFVLIHHHLSFPIRIFMGKNKVAQIALGRSPEEEYRDNLCNVSKVFF
jgi:hypothetical protein